MSDWIKVEIPIDNLAACSGEAEAQFLVRRKLQDAGIPLGPWGTSRPARGVLQWRDDMDKQVLVVQWRDSEEPQP